MCTSSPMTAQMCLYVRSVLKVRLLQALKNTSVRTAQMINQCCAVAVASEAMDGVAPELRPGWVHRRKNSTSTVRQAQVFTAYSELLAVTGVTNRISIQKPTLARSEPVTYRADC